MWLDSVQSILVEMAGKAVSASDLRPGSAMQGTIEGVPGRLTLVVAGARVPLPKDANLTPDQRVHVEVIETGKRLQLRLTPSPAEEGAQPRPASATLETIVARVLEALGVPNQPETPTQVLPRALPQTDAAIRSVLSLFTQQATTGDDLQTISLVLSQAAANGTLPADVAGEAAALIARFVPRDSGDFQAVLRQLGRGVAVEAEIAQAISTSRLESLPGTLRADLRAVLSQLRDNEGLASYLQAKGQLNTFQSAVDRVLDRISSGQLQNLHSLEQPYVFFEVPFPTGAPLREARVHLFREGRGTKHGAEGRSASVTLDLSTTKLGDLWITLQLTEGHCGCRVAVTSEPVAETIEAAREELVNAIESAGYARATVHVDLWDGDRLRETAHLMRRFSGIDVKA